MRDEMNYDEHKKIIDGILNRQPQGVRDRANKFYQICDEVYHKQLGRSKRDIDALMEKHLQWLTPEQKAEIKQMKANGEPLSAIKQKLLSYIGIMETDKQFHIIEKTKQSCYAWLGNVTSVEERVELEKLHHSDHSACKRKVREYIKRLPPGEQEAVNKDLEVCEHIWYNEGRHESGHEHHHHHQQHRGARCLPQKIHAVAHGRSKRDHHEHNLDEYFRTHLSWLTDIQKDEIRKMKEEGKPKADMQKKIFDYYESLTGDEKKEASEKLREGCRALLKQIVGDEKMAELKQMKDSGVGIEELIAKVDHMLEHVTDEPKKEKIQEYGPACRKIYGDRHKRDHHEHNLDEYFRTHLSWLTDIQKDEIRKMKEEGKPKADMQKKIFDYYESLTGDEKKEASEKLREGCRALLKQIVGDEKMAELKQMKDSGVGIEELIAKVDHMLEHVTDEPKKEKIQEYGPACRKIYGDRHKRDHHEHNLDEYFRTHLSWLTDIQKDEIRKMKEEGKPKADMQKKIFDYYESLTGDEKKEASEKLREGCRALLKQIVGDEKMAELKQMKDSGVGIEELIAKVDHMLEHVTDEPKKEKIQEYGPACRKIYGDRHKRDHHEHNLDEYFRTHLSWLTDIQKDEIRKMKEEGKPKADMQKKIFDYYESLTGDEKKEASEKLREGCRALLKQIVGDEKMAELKQMKDSGVGIEELIAKVDHMLEHVTDEPKKEKIQEYGPACRKIYGDRHKRDHHEHNLDEYFRTHLSWLTDIQKDEIRKMKEEGKPKADMQKKIFDYYESLTGDEKKEASEKLREGCRALLKQIVGDEKMAELKQMKDSGVGIEELIAKVDHMLEHVTDEPKKEKIQEYGPACRKIYGDRHKRDHHEHNLDEYFRTHLSWLTDIQKDEIRKMKEEGKPKADMQKKIFDYYESLTGDEKKEASEKLREGCRALLKQIVGDEKMAELKQMKDSGVGIEELIAKVDHMLEHVTDEPKKEKIQEYGPACRKIYGDRHKRDHHEHNLDEYFRTHLSWLTDIQKDEIRKMKEEGKPKADMQKKIFDYYESLTGDEKKEASEKLREGCRALLKQIVGDEKMAELKQMKDSGVGIEELIAKVDHMLEHVTDEPKKEKIQEYGPACRKIYGDRHKRDHHEHNLDEYFRTHLSWLTDIQKDEIRKMKEEGKPKADMQKKIFDYYESLTGDEKKEASEKLREGCRALLKQIVGDEKMAELKQMKDSGVGIEELIAKVDHMLEHVTDEPKKEKIQEYGPACRKIYGDRHKRDHHEHNLDEYFRTHLSWLTDIQKDEIRKMKEEGKPKADMQKKIFDYYESLTGDEKKEASEKLREGCRALLKQIVGDEKMAELKQMKDSGVGIEELIAKVDHMLEHVTDEPKKEKIQEYGPACRKIYGDRHKRDHHEHNLDEYFRTHLSWLTDIQKDEIRKMKEEGKPKADMQKKIFDYYESLTGDEKKEASEKLREGCRALLKQIVGDEKMAELKQMKDSGVGIEELIAKVDHMLEHVTDEPKKEKIQEYGPACRKIYGDRHKRDHHEHNLDEYFRTHLSWLTDIQKDEIRKMKEEGKPKADMQKKIFDYYESLTGDEKKEASEKLREGCRALLKQIVGDEKMAELKQMKDSGVGIEELIAKVDHMLEHVTDEPKKEKIQEYGPACRKIYGDRHKRDHHEHNLDEYFRTHLSWLTDIQKDEIRKMKEEGKPKADMQKKFLIITKV
uniref:Polyprotein allergen nematode domain-containing protein n=1 Tax=Loa loa TaxID=7209 RepID=A0A1I7VUT6_LOALO